MRALNPDVVAALKIYIDERNAKFGGVTIKLMQDFLAEDHEVKIVEGTLRDLLHRIGYTWGPAKKAL